MRGDYIEIVIEAGLVTGIGGGQARLRRFDGCIMLLEFLGQDSQCRKTVFDFLKGGQV
jgi:hypothetical protein